MMEATAMVGSNGNGHNHPAPEVSPRARATQWFEQTQASLAVLNIEVDAPILGLSQGGCTQLSWEATDRELTVYFTTLGIGYTMSSGEFIESADFNGTNEQLVRVFEWLKAAPASEPIQFDQVDAPVITLSAEQGKNVERLIGMFEEAGFAAMWFPETAQIIIGSCADRIVMEAMRVALTLSLAGCPLSTRDSGDGASVVAIFDPISDAASIEVSGIANFEVIKSDDE